MAEEGRGGSLEKFVFYFGAPASNPPRAIGSPAPASASGDPPATLSDCHTKLDAVADEPQPACSASRFRAARQSLRRWRKQPDADRKGACGDRASFPGPRHPRVECRGHVCRLDFAEPRIAALAVLGQENVALGGLVQTEPGPTKSAVFLTTVQSGWNVPGDVSSRPGRLASSRAVPSPAARQDSSAAARALDRPPERRRPVQSDLHARPRRRAGQHALWGVPGQRIGTLVASEELPSPVGDFVRMESWSWAPGSPPQLLDH